LRVVQLHNIALDPGGMEGVRGGDTAALARMGAEVVEYTVKNAEVEEIGRLRAGAKAIWNREACRDVRNLVDRFRPDIAHVYTPFPIMSPAVFRVLGELGIPTVTTVQSFRYSCIKAILFREGRVCEVCVGRRMKLAGIRHRCYHDSIFGSAAMTAGLVLHSQLGSYRDAVDLWLPATEFVGRRLVAEGIDAEKVIPHPNTTPDPGCGGNRGNGRVVYAGRFVPEKGIDTLVAAWAADRDLPGLDVYGDGAMREVVQEAARRDSRITWHGWVDQATLIPALASASFLVLPSEWYEGHPVIAVQALACGTPLIASDVGNFTEMVQPGVNGYHFRSGNPQSLAEAVRTASTVSDKELGAMRAAARASYEDTFSEKRHAERLFAAYERAVRSRGRGLAPQTSAPLGLDRAHGVVESQD